MSVIRLRPIAVTVYDGAAKTGTGAVWADDDPATYTTLSSSSGAQRAIGQYPVDPSVAGATSITFGMTYDLSSMVGIQLIAVSPGSRDAHVNPPGTAPSIAVGTGLTYAYTFADADYAAEGTTLEAVVSRFVSGPVSPETAEVVPAAMVSGFTGLVVREQWLDFTLPDVIPPLRHLTRRDLTSTTGRVNGPRSQQGSLRRGNGHY